ncbi:hypothetical protein [Cohnella cellulosilytica]|uniref:hypothetical protein n=1 Tax=Cohnella cellulosilytica TaxID=986710 RepID=UPI00361CE6AF
MEPWFYIVALGAAIAGLAWMMPKSGHGGSEQEFVSEEAYGRLLEDLEAENRELLDAVAKFKREHDGTTELLGRRIVELEQQMKLLSETPPLPRNASGFPLPGFVFSRDFFSLRQAIQAALRMSIATLVPLCRRPRRRERLRGGSRRQARLT